MSQLFKVILISVRVPGPHGGHNRRVASLFAHNKEKKGEQMRKLCRWMEPSYCCVDASHCFMWRENKNVTVTKCNLNWTILLLFLISISELVTGTLCQVFILFFIFFVETKWDSVAFHVFCFVFVFLPFLCMEAERWHSKRVCSGLSSRAAGSQSERVWPSACTSLLRSAANTCTKLGMKYSSTRARAHTRTQQCGACARVYSLNVR